MPTLIPFYDALSDGTSATVCLAYAEGDRTVGLPPAAGSTIEALRQLLVQAGFILWDRHCDCPTEDLAATEAILSRATEACDNYVILLSPQAIGDVVCLEGLLFALSLNKRVLPILLASVETEHLPEPLQGLAWIDLRSATAPLAHSIPGRQLIQRLQYQADYHRTHTRLLTAALAWERQDRHPSALLPPPVGRDYQRWLYQAQCQPQRYRPLYLQALFVAESLRQGDIRAASTKIPQPTMRTRTWLKRWLGDDP